MLAQDNTECFINKKDPNPKSVKTNCVDVLSCNEDRIFWVQYSAAESKYHCASTNYCPTDQENTVSNKKYSNAESKYSAAKNSNLRLTVSMLMLTVITV